MAKIAEYLGSNGDPSHLPLPLAPAGTFIARIGWIQDQFCVSRPKFDAPHETEVVDVTRFTFAFKDKGGSLQLIQTVALRISGHPKSRLVNLLQSIIGSEPWLTDSAYDYNTLEGQAVQITVAHQQAKKTGRIYTLAECSSDKASRTSLPPF